MNKIKLKRIILDIEEMMAYGELRDDEWYMVSLVKQSAEEALERIENPVKFK